MGEAAFQSGALHSPCSHISPYDLGPIGELCSEQAQCEHEKTLHTPDVRRLSSCLSNPRAHRTGPVSRSGEEGDGFGATTKTHTATRGRGPAYPQGRGSKIRGDQERSFAFRNAEDEATPRHPQRKRAGVAENS